MLKELRWEDMKKCEQQNFKKERFEICQRFRARYTKKGEGLKVYDIGSPLQAWIKISEERVATKTWGFTNKYENGMKLELFVRNWLMS